MDFKRLSSNIIGILIAFLFLRLVTGEFKWSFLVIYTFVFLGLFLVTEHRKQKSKEKQQ